MLVNLGREDNLDVDALRRLVASINRYLGDADDACAPLGAEAGPLSVDSARPVGAIWLLDGLWRMLEIDKALAGVLGTRRFRTDVERVVFALVANRAVAPSSKHAAADWVTHTVRGPRPGGDEQGPGDAGYGPAGKRRRPRQGVPRGVLLRSHPAEPRGRPDLLRHDLHLLRTRRRSRSGTRTAGAAGASCAGSGNPRTTAGTCRRS